MDDALRKLAQSVQVIRSLHRGTGGRDVLHEPHKRAEEQGYSIKGYHFTRGQRAENIAKTGKFDPTRSFSPDEEATFFWTHPDAANEWANFQGFEHYPTTPMGEDILNRKNPVIMPVRVNPGKHIDIDWLEHSKHLQQPAFYNSQLMGNLINHAKKNGYDTMRIRNMSEGMSQPHDQLAVLNPTNIRSEFAQFNPERQHENDIGAHTGGYIKGYATKGAVTDPLELAKSVKPLHRSGGGRDIIPTNLAMPEPNHPLAPTVQRENTPGIIASPYPGMRGRKQEAGLDPSIQPDDAFTKWTPSTPNLIGAPVPPPIQHPLHNEPRHEKISRVASNIFKSKGFQDLAEDITGLRGIKAVPIHGMYEGNREPSFSFQHPNMTKEGAQKLANLVGFGFGQDSTVRVDHDAHANEVTPAMLIGTGNVLNKKHIDAIMEHAKNEGIDGASSTEDGKAVKFLHFGGDEHLPDFIDKVNRVADKSGMPHRLMAHANTELVNNEDYVKNLFGENRTGEGGSDGKPQTSDLFKRTVDHVLAPYAKGIAGEGFRLSPERLAESHGLMPHEEDYVRNAMYPTGKKSEDRTTVPLMEGKENLEVRPTGARGVANVDDVLYGLQNRAAEKGQIDPNDRSDKARDLIAHDIAKEVGYHMDHSDKSAIGWYDEALKKAMSHYHKIFPELEHDPEKAMQFKAILGITSQGNNVFENSTYAARMYDLIRNGATMPEAIKKLKGSFGNQTNAIEQNLQKYHHLMETNGYDRMSDLFNQTKPVSEWKKILSNDKSLFGPNGKPLTVKGSSDQKITGWSVFGPKIGSFINNLHGDYSTLTADLWFTRTWNRLLGHNFVHNPETESGQLQNFKDALKAEFNHHNYSFPTENKFFKERRFKDFTTTNKIDNGKITNEPWLYGTDTKNMTPEEYDRLMNDPDAMLQKAQELESIYRKGGYKEKSDLRRRAKNWVENREKSEAAPRSDTERNFQQQTAERAQQILKRKTGKNISVADIQAALWFHEKELFAKYGVASEKAKPADYEDAAKRAVEQYHSGDLHKVKSTGKSAGDASREDEEPEHDARGGLVRRAYMKGGKVEGSVWHERDAFGFGGDTESAGSAPERGGSGTVAAEHEAAPEQHEQRQSDPEGREHPSSEAEKLANQGTFPSWAGVNSGGNEAAVNKSAADVAASRLAQAEHMSVLNNGVTNAQATAAETPPSAASAANAAMSAAFSPVGATTSFGQQPPQAGLFTPEHFESTLEQNLVEPAFSQPMTQPAFPHTPTPTADTATHLGGTPATGVIPDTATHLGGTPATGALGVTQPSFPHTPTPDTAYNTASFQPDANAAARQARNSITQNMGADPTSAPIAVASTPVVRAPTSNIPTPPTRPAELGPSAVSGNIFDQINAANLQRISDLEAQKNKNNPGYFNSTSGLSKQEWADQMGADPTTVQTRLVDMGNGMQPDYYTKGLDQVFGEMVGGIAGAPSAIMSGIGNAFSPSQNYDPLTGKSRPDISPFVGGGQETGGKDFLNSGKDQVATAKPKTHMVQKLMPDGTYQWVEEPFKKGGKVYRPLVGSQMTDHVISKFGVPLSASKYQPNGNKAGRR